MACLKKDRTMIILVKQMMLTRMALENDMIVKRIKILTVVVVPEASCSKSGVRSLAADSIRRSF
jgi:hypothetical protein